MVKTRIAESELILNADGSIYHLNLLPEDIATTIITVGDPDRVADVSSFFDSIELKKGKREFITHTGNYKNKRITVISTGIGTDNIDIVFNELDALVNVDFKTRTEKETKISLDIIRIGTSGSIQSDIPINSFLLSEYAIGFDSLLHFYKSDAVQFFEISDALKKHSQWDSRKSDPYVVKYNGELAKKLISDKIILGNTGTNVGFYGPQSRKICLPLNDLNLNEKLSSFVFNSNKKITNLEMETAGIYGLSKLLGHRACSMNCILANRTNGTFSENPNQKVKELIEYTLDKLTS